MQRACSAGANGPKRFPRELHKPGRAEDGSDYFDCWVAALSDLIVDNGIADAETILALQQSWQRAAEATPHGRPILAGNDPSALISVTGRELLVALLGHLPQRLAGDFAGHGITEFAVDPVEGFEIAR